MIDQVKRGEELDRRDRKFSGLLVLSIGLLALLLNITQAGAFSQLILPALGLAFLFWGFYTRRFGFTIPGCILTGLGIALFLTQRVPDLAGAASGGVFVLGLAGGFLAIALIAPYFEQKRVWWPLIPGGILGLVGILMFLGDEGLGVLQLLSNVWPLFLVIVGLYILFVPRKRQS
jgi:hypothetical protein